MSNIPALRFPNFADDWQLKKIGTLTERVTNPVDVQDDKLYSQIGFAHTVKEYFTKKQLLENR